MLGLKISAITPGLLVTFKSKPYELSLSFIFYIHLSMSTAGDTSAEENRALEAGVTGSCELPSECAGNQDLMF